MRAQQPEHPYHVLFLCTGNSARSIFGEAILNRLGAGKFRAFSAGSNPAGKVNPRAIELLERLGYPTFGLRSKSWEEFATTDAPALDFIFTVCDAAANEVCPVWPGRPVTAHWAVPDPAAVSGDDGKIDAAFRQAFTLLQRRIELFSNLPIKGLDRLSLGNQLAEIGRTR